MSDQVIADRRKWVERVLGFRFAGPTSQPIIDAGTLNARLVKARERVGALQNVPHLGEDLRSAILAVKAGRPREASDLLDQLEARLRSAERAAEAARTIAAAPGKSGAVGFAKLRLKWTAAVQSRDQALGQLQASCSDMMALEEVRDDPRFAELQSAVSGLASRMPDVDGGIGKALDAMISATDIPVRDHARRQALKAISESRARLDAEPLLKALQKTETGSYPIYDQIAHALDALAAELGG